MWSHLKTDLPPALHLCRALEPSIVTLCHGSARGIHRRGGARLLEVGLRVHEHPRGYFADIMVCASLVV